LHRRRGAAGRNLAPRGALTAQTHRRKEAVMLSWAVVFLLIALVAAFFGFGGIATASAGIAQILFFVFIALFVIALIANAVRGRAPRP
jgi:uncharacterized membrane protein YtjA (UPF0391 family)